MKKTIIAGTASLILATIPVMGVFAEETAEDTVTLKIVGSCSVSANGEGKTIPLSGANSGEFGGTTGQEGTTFNVTCNSKGGWKLNANATDMTSGNETIKFGKYGTDSSVWSAMIKLDPTTADGAVEIENGWDAFTNEKTTGDKQIASSKANEDGSLVGVSGLTITPYYKAYVVDGQTEGEYSAKVTYTLYSEAPTVTE